MLHILFAILLFLIAVSVDSITAGLTYGTGDVHIKPLSYVFLIGIPALFVTLSNQLGTLLCLFFSEKNIGLLSFALLLFMGCEKLLESLIRYLAAKYPSLAKNWGCKIKQLNIIFTIYLSPEDANQKDRQILSAGEALLLSLALSLDSILVGMAFHLATLPWPLLFLLASLMNYLFFLTGYGIGRSLAARSRIDLSWLSGLILLLLSVLALL